MPTGHGVSMIFIQGAIDFFSFCFFFIIFFVIENSPSESLVYNLLLLTKQVRMFIFTKKQRPWRPHSVICQRFEGGGVGKIHVVSTLDRLNTSRMILQCFGISTPEYTKTLLQPTSQFNASKVQAIVQGCHTFPYM